MILEILAFIIIGIELYEILKHYKKENLFLYEILLLVIIGLVFMTKYTLLKILILLICSYLVHKFYNRKKDIDDSLKLPENAFSSHKDNKTFESKKFSYESESKERQKDYKEINNINSQNIISEYMNISEKIDINNASMEELSYLPHITRIKAKKIIVYREAGYNIKSYDDLKEKLLLNDFQIEQIKEKSIIKENSTNYR